MPDAPHFSDFYTPLYDNEHGGAPRAYICELFCEAEKVSDLSKRCSALTRTKIGMLMHLQKVHGVTLDTNVIEFPKEDHEV